MIDAIRNFFSRSMEPPAESAADDAHATRRLHIAACALLLELAHADDEFTDAERRHVEGAIRRHLDLDENAARDLMDLAEAERREAIDLYQFTSLIRESYDLAQKTVLAEIMWSVVLADGNIAQDESYMLRKIGNLLDLKPGFLSHAKRRVTEPD